MKEKVIQILFIGIILVITLSIIIGGWFIGRKLHYKFAYKSMVQQTITEMVKQEALK
jgi:hypothetical protein